MTRSEAKMGHIVSPATRAKISASLIGRPHPHGPISQETREKISASLSGRQWSVARRANCRPTAEFRAKISAVSRGRKRSAETRRKMSAAKLGHSVSQATATAISVAKTGKPVFLLQGANNPNWKGGITLAQEAARSSLEAKLWRKAVFERDNYTCTGCGARGGYLNADHIKPFADYPELRWELDNGRTLCVSCHRQTPTYGSRRREAHLIRLGDGYEPMGILCGN